MNVNIARKIDRWVGIPLCFVLSIICFLQRILSFRRKEAEPRPKKILFLDVKRQSQDQKKILFLEFSEMGSAILAHPAISKAKQLYPNIKLYFWIFKENQDSVHILNIIPKEHVITIDSRNCITLIASTLKSILYVRKQRIEIAIDMELFSRFSSILTYLSGANIRAGFHSGRTEGLYRGSMHTHTVLYNPYYHMSKNFLALILSLRSNIKDPPLLKEEVDSRRLSLPKLKSNSTIKASVWRRLKTANRNISSDSSVIVIHAGFKDRLGIRRWPMGYHKDLVSKLQGKPDRFIIFVGMSPWHKDTLIPDYKNCIDMVGKTTTRELVEILHSAHLLISHDSGMLHIASLTNVYIIGLFGPETPLLYGPLSDNKRIFYKRFYCSPCLSAYNHRDSTCTNNKCMHSITVDEVYKEVEKILS